MIYGCLGHLADISEHRGQLYASIISPTSPLSSKACLPPALILLPAEEDFPTFPFPPPAAAIFPINIMGLNT